MTNQKIHTHPRLCYMTPEEFNDKSSMVASTKIDEVTCKVCIYYYFHPEAKRLELAFRDNKR